MGCLFDDLFDKMDKGRLLAVYLNHGLCRFKMTDFRRRTVRNPSSKEYPRIAQKRLSQPRSHDGGVHLHPDMQCFDFHRNPQLTEFSYQLSSFKTVFKFEGPETPAFYSPLFDPFFFVSSNSRIATPKHTLPRDHPAHGIRSPIITREDKLLENRQP